MEKSYQKEVITLGDNIFDSLVESELFTENEIKDTSPAKGVIYDFLTEKFIEGKIVDGAVEATDEEMIGLFKTVLAKCVLNDLQNIGLTDTYDGDSYFLTEEGEKVAKEQMKKDNN